MDKIDRIQLAHRLFKQHRYGLTLVTLAEKLECSTKTVQRLIDDMRNYFGAPIEYDREQHSYVYRPEATGDYELPGLWLTANELRAMAGLLHLLKEMGEGFVAGELQPLEEEVAKLAQHRRLDIAQLRRRVRFISSGRRPVVSNVFSRVGEALMNGKQLSIQYADHKGDSTQRTLSPQTLVYYRDNWYLDAWCHLRNDLRTFMLPRIKSAKPTEEAATAIEAERLDAHFQQSYGIFAGQATQTAELLFEPQAGLQVAEQQWHSNAKGYWTEEGADQGYRLDLPYSDERELVRDLLGFAGEVTILNPPELVVAYRNRLRAGLNLNHTK